MQSDEHQTFHCGVSGVERSQPEEPDQQTEN